jgi:hypothetical protein
MAWNPARQITKSRHGLAEWQKLATPEFLQTIPIRHGLRAVGARKIDP